jgi:hypothetical protein
MIEFIKHATGACGEHWHPNLLTLFTSFLGISTSFYYIKYKLTSKIKNRKQSSSGISASERF